MLTPRPLVFSDDLVLARRGEHRVLYSIGNGLPTLLADVTSCLDAWAVVDALDMPAEVSLQAAA